MAVMDSWLDLWNSEEPLDFEEFLESPLLAARRNQVKIRVITFNVVGSISFIASVSLAFHILRTHDGLSTTYHRLVMGLSIADIMSSFAIALSSIMVPREMNYLVPYARGNAASCVAQGFLIMVGYITAKVYNSCILCYYLSIIKYNKKDEYIRNKLEPWFHGVAVIFPLVFGFFILGFHRFHADPIGGGICFHRFRNNPPHCIGREAGFLPENFTIPCGLGGGMGMTAYKVILLTPLVISSVTIVSTMTLIYRAVLKTEEKVQRYGSRALRISTRPGNIQRYSVRPLSVLRSLVLKMRKSSLGLSLRNTSMFGSKYTPPETDPSIANHLDNNIVGNVNDTSATEEEAGAEGVMDKIKSAYNCLFLPSCCCRRREENVVYKRSSMMERQRRSVLNMAFAYSMAWALVWIPFIGKNLFRSFPFEMCTAILTPLQGLYNLCVFLFPKARDIKNRSKNESIGWLQAFAKAFISRGDKRRNRSTRNLSSGNSRSQSRGKRNSIKSLFLTQKSSGKFPTPQEPSKEAPQEPFYLKSALKVNRRKDAPQAIGLNQCDIDVEENIEEQAETTELASPENMTKRALEAPTFYATVNRSQEGLDEIQSAGGVNDGGNMRASVVTFKLHSENND